jgi:alpha-glucuronidase
MTRFVRNFFMAVILSPAGSVHGEGGYRLWLRYEKVTEPKLAREYETNVKTIVVAGGLPTLSAARDTSIRYFQLVNHKPLPVYLNSPQ